MLSSSDLRGDGGRVAPRATALRWPASAQAWATAIIAALAVQGLVSPVAGTACCAVLVLMLVSHDAIAGPGDEPGSETRLGLALVPLAAILALSLPVDRVAPALWPAMVATALLLGIQRAADRLGLRRRELGLVVGSWRAQVAIASAGLPLGLLAAVVLEPAPLAVPEEWYAVAAAALAVGVFAGATEELLLRGVLQPLLVRATGPRGVAWTAALSAALYAGSHSPAIVAAAGALALWFGALRQRTGSIVGIAAAHALLVGGALVVWPALLGM